MDVLSLASADPEERDRQLDLLLRVREAGFEFDPSWLADISEKRRLECVGVSIYLFIYVRDTCSFWSSERLSPMVITPSLFFFGPVVSIDRPSPPTPRLVC